MDFSEFKKKYIHQPVIEYPNQREGKIPLVTVKVVTYNHINYIEQCLDSILMQQTDFDFEILIAEDDSSDGTREICKQYADKYPDKIRLLLNSRENNIAINGKPSGTFNSVYANYCIKSKYIAIIEGDDYWTDKLSIQKRVDFLEANDDYVLCFHNAKIYNQNLNKFYGHFKAPFKKSITIDRKLTYRFMIPTLTLMFRNGLIELYEQGMEKIISGDTILIAKLAYFGSIRYIHEIEPAVYRIHDNGIHSSTSISEKRKRAIITQSYLLNYFEAKKWNLNNLNESIARVCFTYFISSIKREKKIKVKYLIKSFIHLRKSKTSLLKVCKRFIINYKNIEL